MPFQQAIFGRRIGLGRVEPAGAFQTPETELEEKVRESEKFGQSFSSSCCRARKTLQGVTGNRLIPINFPTQAQKGGNAGPVGRRQEGGEGKAEAGGES